MTIKLHGYPTGSFATQRTALIFHELGVPFEFVHVDLPSRAHKTPEHLDRHPFGQVPYIEDGELILYESRAIARYLCLTHTSPLLPTSPPARVALFEQAVSAEAANFETFTSMLGQELIFIPRRGGKTDPALAQRLRTLLLDRIEGYERILTKSRFLCGDEITLADLFHLPRGAMLCELEIGHLGDDESFPAVARWWKEISARPSWLAVKDKVESFAG